MCHTTFCMHHNRVNQMRWNLDKSASSYPILFANNHKLTSDLVQGVMKCLSYRIRLACTVLAILHVPTNLFCEILELTLYNRQRAIGCEPYCSACYPIYISCISYLLCIFRQKVCMLIFISVFIIILRNFRYVRT